MPLPPHWLQLVLGPWAEGFTTDLLPHRFMILTSVAGFDPLNPENFLKAWGSKSSTNAALKVRPVECCE